MSPAPIHHRPTLLDVVRTPLPAAPRSIPPADHRHEFLSEWLDEGDPVLIAWERHFTLTDTPYRRAVINGQVMLYRHRFQTPPTNGAISGQVARWCCRS